jgi:hypothetical protein
MTVEAKGGYLIWQGVKYGYEIWIDWDDEGPGDEGPIEKISLDASTSLLWSGSNILCHTYETPDDYTITIKARPAWMKDPEKFVETKKTITIVEDDTPKFPTDEVCPVEMHALSCFKGWCSDQEEWSTYVFDNLQDLGNTEYNLKEATCHYKISGGSDKANFKARSLKLYYENQYSNSYGCNQPGDSDYFSFPDTPFDVYSTKRTLMADLDGWDPDSITNPRSLLEQLLSNAVEQQLGAPCPQP